jgi:hypothetical protein
VFHLLPGAVRIGDADADGGHPIGLLIETIILLARQLMDAIDAQSVKGVSFIHRIVFDAAIDKSRTSKEQFRPGILNPAGLYHLEVPLQLISRSRRGSILLST